VLRTAREPRFFDLQSQHQAVENLRRHGIDGLVVIGGNGSMHGARALDRLGVPVIGVPASIDNDLDGTDFSIGVDTALNTIVRAIDALKDTASAHERTFVVEVMGRDCGYLALTAGMAGGAEAVIVPESPPDYDRIVANLERGYARGKRHGIVVCAEGAASGQAVADELSRRSELQLRVTVLGHVQRGGVPSVADRLLGTQLGAAAVDRLIGGRHDEMACWRNNAVVFTPLVEALARQRPLSLSDQRLARVLAR
jgi:6-phosphofructokinase 1